MKNNIKNIISAIILCVLLGVILGLFVSNILNDKGFFNKEEISLEENQTILSGDELVKEDIEELNNIYEDYVVSDNNNTVDESSFNVDFNNLKGIDEYQLFNYDNLELIPAVYEDTLSFDEKEYVDIITNEGYFIFNQYQEKVSYVEVLNNFGNFNLNVYYNESEYSTTYLSEVFRMVSDTYIDNPTFIDLEISKFEEIEIQGDTVFTHSIGFNYYDIENDKYYPRMIQKNIYIPNNKQNGFLVLVLNYYESSKYNEMNIEDIVREAITYKFK